MRTAIFVDLGNLYHTVLTKFNKKIDFSKLVSFCSGDDKPARAIAYGVGGSKNRGFKLALQSAGFTTNFKSPKKFSDGTQKADQDLQIAADIFRFRKEYDRLILISADGDFAPVLKLCSDYGKTIIVVGCGVSHELKEVAHTWWEIGEELL